VEIELWSDFACPWCALGLYRLEAARQQFAHGDAITVVHRSFELDPAAPARGTQTLAEVLASKYGMSPDQVRAGHERLTALGHEVGMQFDFDRVQRTNTFDAHRLTQAARGTTFEDALVKGLFAAYFTEGQLLSDHHVLLGVAQAAGMPLQAAHAVLESDSRGAEVRAGEGAARQRGISGVPHFVIDGKWAVSGAQDTDTLLLALDRAWERTDGSAPAGARAT